MPGERERGLTNKSGVVSEVGDFPDQSAYAPFRTPPPVAELRGALVHDLLRRLWRRVWLHLRKPIRQLRLRPPSVRDRRQRIVRARLRRAGDAEHAAALAARQAAQDRPAQ